MNPIEFLLKAFDRNRDQPAILWKDQSCTYGQLLEQVAHWQARLDKDHVKPGMVVSLTGDFSPHSIAALLALTARTAIIAPVLRTASQAHRDNIRRIAQIEHEY